MLIIEYVSIIYHCEITITQTHDILHNFEDLTGGALSKFMKDELDAPWNEFDLRSFYLKVSLIIRASQQINKLHRT